MLNLRACGTWIFSKFNLTCVVSVCQYFTSGAFKQHCSFLLVYYYPRDPLLLCFLLFSMFYVFNMTCKVFLSLLCFYHLLLLLFCSFLIEWFLFSSNFYVLPHMPGIVQSNTHRDLFSFEMSLENFPCKSRKAHLCSGF